MKHNFDELVISCLDELSENGVTTTRDAELAKTLEAQGYDVEYDTTESGLHNIVVPK